MAELTGIAQLAGSLTVSGVLLIGLWAVVTGRVPTRGELQRVIDSEQRAWGEVEKAQQELAANNRAIEQAATNVGQATAAVGQMTAALARLQDRLDYMTRSER